MKFIIILLLLFSFACSSSHYYNKHPFIYIEFDIPDKLQMNQDIPLKFKITNNEDVDIILEKNYLMFYCTITDSCFQPLVSNTGVLSGEWVVILDPITIDKNSQDTIEIGNLSFNAYNFEPDKSYILQAKYQNYDSYSDSVFTFIGEIGPYLKKFKFYK